MLLKRIATVTLASAATFALSAGMALAAVSYAPDSGGSVGKGDVQLLFGWNDKALQSNASGVTFDYVSSDTYSFTCTFTNITGGSRNTQTQVHTSSREKTAEVDASVTYETKGSKKITGFLLNAAGEGSTSGDDVPENGDFCPGGNQQDGVVSDVELVDSSGGLTVTHGSVTHDLPNTPTV